MNNLLRFGLELTALIAVAIFFWKGHTGATKYLLAICTPLILMTIWGVFNVPNDPSRSGNAPVVVPGFVRLIVEVIVFGSGVYCMFKLTSIGGWVMLGLLIFHYAFAWDRISWLIKQ